MALAGGAFPRQLGKLAFQPQNKVLQLCCGHRLSLILEPLHGLHHQGTRWIRWPPPSTGNDAHANVFSVLKDLYSILNCTTSCLTVANREAVFCSLVSDGSGSGSTCMRKVCFERRERQYEKRAVEHGRDSNLV
jgi:hypothetical protein